MTETPVLTTWPSVTVSGVNICFESLFICLISCQQVSQRFQREIIIAKYDELIV